MVTRGREEVYVERLCGGSGGGGGGVGEKEICGREVGVCVVVCGVVRWSACFSVVCGLGCVCV